MNELRRIPGASLPLGREMAWLSSRPPGRSSAYSESKYSAGLRGADVLEHADRRDRVERRLSQLAVVLQADLDPVGDAGGLDALRERAAPARVRASRRRRARRSGARHGSPSTPAAADVEQPHAGPRARASGRSASCLASCASSRVMSGCGQKAQEYVMRRRARAGRSRCRRRSGGRSPGRRASRECSLPPSRASSGGGATGRPTTSSRLAARQRETAVRTPARRRRPPVPVGGSSRANTSPSMSTSPATKARPSPSSFGW